MHLITGMLRWFLYPLLCYALLIPAHGEERRAYLNRFWQTSEGMPSNVVSAVQRDREGFLWLATGAGVTRFDGESFQIFDGKDGLPDTQILSLHIDQRGRVWAGTRKGAVYRENGEWIIPAGLPTESIFSIGEANDGSIWIGTYNGCWRWNAGKAVKVDLGDVIPDTRAFLPDGPNDVLILTQGHLCRWKPEEPGIAREVEGPWQGRDLRDFTRDPQGRIIVCGTGLLLRQNSSDGWNDLNPRIPGGEENANLACEVGTDGILWIATRNRGLVYLGKNGPGVVDRNHDLSLDDVRGLLIDPDGLIWAGTNGGGINRLRRRLFDTYSTQEGLGRTVTSALVMNHAGTVWAGTDGGGIFRKDGEVFVPAFPELTLPGDGLIWSMCATRDGSLWVGTYRDGLMRIHDGVIDQIPISNDIPQNSISALHETRDGGLLIGIHGEGVVKWKDGKIDTSIQGPVGEKFVVYDVIEDHLGRIWVATGSFGLWRHEDDHWVNVAKDLGMPNLLATALHEGTNGDVWIGSLGQGLVRYRDEKLKGWNREDGIISDIVSQILEDHAGNLWLGSDRGLQRISLAALEAHIHGKNGVPMDSLTLSREDGLPTPQFSGEHGDLCARGGDGTLWFALASGAIRLDPDQALKPLSPPSVRIESASTEKGRIWGFEGRNAADGIVLPPGAGTLQIRFTTPDFIAPERSRFRYRMGGLENEWQESSGARMASYASLQPGSYQFEVIGAKYDGTWNLQPERVNVEVKPFIWQTMGFRFAASMLGLIALGLLVRAWSLRRIRRRMAFLLQESRVEKERARIARDLHDELGASLTEINFLGTLTADAVEDGKVKQRVEGIVERAQRMAKSLDEIVWIVNPANDTLSSTANYLSSRTQESLGAADIRCRMEIADYLPNITLDSELRHHLLMVVNEAVNNVMKHADATECHLAIRVENEHLLVTVCDDGQGFDPSQLPEDRNGLINLRRRMEAVNGTCEVETLFPHGTRVRFRLPLP